MENINMRKEWHEMLTAHWNGTLSAELVPVLYQYLVDSGLVFLVGPRATRTAKELADAGLIDLAVSGEVAESRKDFIDSYERVNNHFKAIEEEHDREVAKTSMLKMVLIRAISATIEKLENLRKKLMK
jgi:hypothetical protein